MDKEEIVRVTLNRLRMEDDVGLNYDNHIRRTIELGEENGSERFS